MNHCYLRTKYYPMMFLGITHQDLYEANHPVVVLICIITDKSADVTEELIQWIKILGLI